MLSPMRAAELEVVPSSTKAIWPELPDVVTNPVLPLEVAPNTVPPGLLPMTSWVGINTLPLELMVSRAAVAGLS